MVMGGSPTSPIRLVARHNAILDSHTKNIFEPLRVGEVFIPFPSRDLNQTELLTADRAYLVPFFVARKLTIDRLAIEITILQAGSQARLGIYRNTPGTNRPSELILDAGLVSTAAVAVVMATINQQLGKGLYWLYLACDDAPTLKANYATFSLIGHNPADLDSGGLYATWRQNGIGIGACADPLGAGYTVLANPAPTIMLRLLSLD